MKLLLLALVLAVVMVANSVAKPTKPTKVTIPPELLEEIKLKGFEVFQKYLKWKEGLPPGGNTKFQTFFLEWLKNKKESTSPIAEAKAAVNGEASPMAKIEEAQAVDEAEDGEESQNYEDDEKPSEIPNSEKDGLSISARGHNYPCCRRGFQRKGRYLGCRRCFD